MRSKRAVTIHIALIVSIICAAGSAFAQGAAPAAKIDAAIPPG